jgi:hypothetical protein
MFSWRSSLNLISLFFEFDLRGQSNCKGCCGTAIKKEVSQMIDAQKKPCGVRGGTGRVPDGKGRRLCRIGM